MNSSSRRMERKPLFSTCRSWRLSSAGGSSDPVGALADADARLLPEQDAQRLGGLAEDRLVLGQQRAGHAKRSRVEVPSTLPRRHAEHAPDVDERPQRAVLEPKDGRAARRTPRPRRPGRTSAAAGSPGSRWPAPAGDRGPPRRRPSPRRSLPQRLAAVDGPQIEQRAGQVHLACGRGRAASPRSASATRPLARARGNARSNVTSTLAR